MTKKLFLTAALMMAFALGAHAAGVGYVDFNQVASQYPLAKKYQSELDAKSKSIQNYVKTQDEQLKKAKTDADRIRIKKNAVAEMEKRQKAYLERRRVVETELNNKITAAAEKIRVQKKLDVIIRRDSMVTGGVNCTSAVLNLLK